MARWRLCIAVFGALVGAQPAFADKAPPPIPSHQLCKDDPAKCEYMTNQRNEFCRNHPLTCENAEEQREARRKFCETNPYECRKMKESTAESRKRHEEHCKAHPEDCPLIKPKADSRTNEAPDQ